MSTHQLPDRKTGLEPEPHATIGLTDKLLDLYRSWPERFRIKVRLGDGCWEWMACIEAGGYGRYRLARDARPRVMNAHRYAFMISYPEIDIAGLALDHLCRVRHCVRPDHLEPVTFGDNVRRGRPANTAGVCRAGLHPWVPENIILEPARPGQPDGVRRCRACRTTYERARNRRRHGSRS